MSASQGPRVLFCMFLLFNSVWENFIEEMIIQFRGGVKNISAQPPGSRWGSAGDFNPIFGCSRSCRGLKSQQLYYKDNHNCRLCAPTNPSTSSRGSSDTARALLRENVRWRFINVTMLPARLITILENELSMQRKRNDLMNHGKLFNGILFGHHE